MSDLLTSLVDRALDRAPLLQRRQPTLFEPATQAAFGEQSSIENAPSLQEEEMLVERESSPAPHQSTFDNPSRFPAPLSQIKEPEIPEPWPARARRAREVDEPDEDRREQVQKHGPNPNVVKFDPNSIAREEQPRALVPRPVARPEEIRVAPQKLIETIIEKRIEREVISELSKEVPATESDAPRPVASTASRKSSRDGDIDQKPLVKVETRPFVPPKEESAIKPATQTRLPPRGEIAAVARAVSRAEPVRMNKQPTPPAIHVTIGRVEVRATPQSSPKVQSARSGPRMSLEDYLRSRGERN